MPNSWGSPIEIERRCRIKASIAAYAYEFLADSIMEDHEFDQLCLEIDIQINTGNRKLDTFFKKEFNPATGYWVHQHPEKEKLKDLYERYYKNDSTSWIE
jgi:hypothetical protein